MSSATARRRSAAQSSRPTVSSDNDDKLGLGWSLGLHAALLVAILLNFVFPGKPVLYVPTLRVDIVGLPDVLKKDLHNIPKTSKDISEALKKAENEAKKIKPLPPPPKAKEVEKAEKDEMVLHPKQSAQETEKQREKRLRAAMDRMKALAKINDEGDASSAPKIKGNAISKGTSLSGDAKESAEASYYDQLRDKLQDNWSLPVWIARQNLSAQVQLFIDSRGQVHSYRITKGSGNPQFDEAVKRTISESAPFPPPPVGLVSSLLADGILVGFPL